MLGKAQMRFAPSLRSFQCCLANSSSAGLIDGGSFSSFQGKSSSASSFYVSLLPTIAGVMPLALCPQAGLVSQAPQHFRSFETQWSSMWSSLCSPVNLAGWLSSTPACPEQFILLRGPFAAAEGHRLTLFSWRRLNGFKAFHWFSVAGWQETSS